jgi:hypothetical protein
MDDGRERELGPDDIATCRPDGAWILASVLLDFGGLTGYEPAS